MQSTSPPCPMARACLSVITPFGVDTMAVPRPPWIFGSSGQARTRHALEAVDHGAAVEILQLDRQRLLRAVRDDVEAGDVAFVLQHLDERGLELRVRDRHFRLARELRVADAGQEV